MQMTEEKRDAGEGPREREREREREIEAVKQKVEG